MSQANPLNRAEPAGAQTGRGGARRIHLVATGLLIVMAAVYMLARWGEARYPALGYVRAFAEAAMVGGLADWFAVTALFRHPLGLPIPHTAIIPRNKDRIGDTLARFLRANFLTPAVVARRMARLDLAGVLGRLLAAPTQGGARFGQAAPRILGDLVDALGDDRLGHLVKGAISQRLESLDLAPLMGKAMEAAMREGRHEAVIDSLIRWAARTLEANEQLIRDMVHDRAGAILRFTGLDETLANAILSGLKTLLLEAADDPAHRLRLTAQEALADLAARLEADPAMQDRVRRVQREIVANPAMQAWMESLWRQGRAALLRAVRDPGSAVEGRLGALLRQLGVAIGAEPDLRRLINRLTRRAVVGLAAGYGDGIVRLVSETVRGWDARTVTGRLEMAVGRDLQYIRINGTLVGGLVGLILHFVESWW